MSSYPFLAISAISNACTAPCMRAPGSTTCPDVASDSLPTGADSSMDTPLTRSAQLDFLPVTGEGGGDATVAGGGSNFNTAATPSVVPIATYLLATVGLPPTLPFGANGSTFGSISVLTPRSGAVVVDVRLLICWWRLGE